jgi:hypothetical protein
MRCPSCQVENPTATGKCQACGKSLKRRSKRSVLEETDTPFSPRAEGRNRAALRAYRLTLLGLTPGLGLVCGPVGMVLGAAARVRGARETGFTAQGPATAAVILGAVITVTNWLGLAFMVVGLGWWT